MTIGRVVGAQPALSCRSRSRRSRYASATLSESFAVSVARQQRPQMRPS